MSTSQKIVGDLRRSLVSQAQGFLEMYLITEEPIDSLEIAKIDESRREVIIQLTRHYQREMRSAGAVGHKGMRDELKSIVEEAARQLSFTRKEVRRNSEPPYIGEPRDGKGPGPIYWVREQQK